MDEKLCPFCVEYVMPPEWAELKASHARLVAALKLAYAKLNDKAAKEEIGALLNELGE